MDYRCQLLLIPFRLFRHITGDGAAVIVQMHGAKRFILLLAQCLEAGVVFQADGVFQPFFGESRRFNRLSGLVLQHQKIRW